MEKDVLAEKKFLESKDKLFKMVESGKMTQEHFINVISELKNKYGVEINPNWGKFRQDNEGRPTELQGGDEALPKGNPPMRRPDGAPFNKFAPPPTGPGGDEALPKGKPPMRRPETGTYGGPMPRPKKLFPGLPKGDPLIHGGEPKAKPSGPDLPGGDPLIYGIEPTAKPIKKLGPKVLARGTRAI